MRFTALIGRNTREFNDSSSTKLLVRNIVDEEGNEFRCHCWVELTDYIESKLARPGDNRWYNCTFEAKLMKYYNRDSNNTDKITLKDIKNICRSKKPIRKKK